MSTIRMLKGITWDHSRGFTSVVATSQRFHELHPKIDIVWQKRSLQEFADKPLTQLADEFDLLVIDHPWVGHAASSGILADLETLLSPEFLADQADNDAATRVVVVRSALEGFFCAGADIHIFAANSTEANKQMVDAARTALARIESSSKIFIALLEGHTLGGGLEIAMACDIRFAAERDFKLGLPETRLGLLPGNGGSQRLPRIVGASHALMLLAGGETIDPLEATRIGLVNRLFAASQAREETHRFAAEVAESAPLAVEAAKRAIREGFELPLQEALQLETSLVDELYDTADASEGFSAALERRDPDFQGH